MSTSRNNKVYDNLVKMLHPNRVLKSSDKMYYIISTILGQEWVTSPYGIGIFSITVDGTVWDTAFLAGADSFVANIEGYIKAAGLTKPQENYFWELYDMRVVDWRRN